MELQYIYTVVEEFGAALGMIAAICLVIIRKKGGTTCVPLIALEFVFAGMWSFDGFAWYYRGMPGQVARIMVTVCNFIQFFLCFVIILIFLRYIMVSVPNTVKEQGWIRPASILVYSIGLVQIAVLNANPVTHFLYYFDSGNFYHRSSGIGFALVSVLALVQFFVVFAILVAGRRELRKSKYLVLLSYVLIPVLSVLFQIFIYGYSLVNMLCMLCALMMFVEEIVSQAAWIEKQRLLAGEQEQKMNNLKAKIALSQLRPHFIYNVLASAAALCRIDTDRAAEAIEDFAEYLRGNIGKLDQDRIECVEEELDYVKVYLKLEQMRFQERLSVAYDTPVLGFRLPPLTVQPIVENAVRHGISVKEEGGLVQIQTREDEHAWRVIIKDDGVGFDVNNEPDDGKEHIGIRAVRERLELMVNGSMEIVSGANGTVATISIPKV